MRPGMCGIIGYIGDREAVPILLKAMERLEYRGYDSWGLAVLCNGIHIEKEVGKVPKEASTLTFQGPSVEVGIAHTRWATHGGVTKDNAHPHQSCNGEVAIVHNGIIENYQGLRASLSSEGHRFASQTDSEIIAHLLEKFYHQTESPREALLATVKEIRGTFALLALFRDHPGVILGARKDSPLLIGVGKGEFFMASDGLAFIEHTDRVLFLNNLEGFIASKGLVELYDFDGNEVRRQTTQVAWEASSVTKKEFAHYTLKEIHEQPSSTRSALYQDKEKLMEFSKVIRSSRRLFITGAGTSYHAGLVAKYLLSKARIYSEAILASEFNQFIDWVDSNTTILAISQSGETADALHAIREAKGRGAKVLSIVNVMGSSLARESDMALYLNCGPEIGVAATKSFTSQLMVLCLTSLMLANGDDEMAKLKELYKNVESTLSIENRVEEIAKKYMERSDFYFVGRSIHYPIALEGALKMKELSYIHAEGMAAGELKHGTLALMDHSTPVVVINPMDSVYHDTLGNALEMGARGAKVIGISNEDNEVYEDFIKIPRVDELFYPIVEVIPLQLLAYHTALLRGADVDRPRNLAKSVTVK